MKKYRTIKDHQFTFTKGEIDTEETLKELDIPKLIEQGIIEEVKDECKRWRAKYNDKYYTIKSGGCVDYFYEISEYIDDCNYLTGNYFQTRELAQQKLDRDLAICRVNDRIRELQGGEISMEEMMDYKIKKYYLYYSLYRKEYDFTFIIPSIIIAIRTKEISQQIIKECKDDLDLIWGINI